MKVINQIVTTFYERKTIGCTWNLTFPWDDLMGNGMSSLSIQRVIGPY